MPRRVQDIIPSGRRSIRDIPVREEETRTRKLPEKEVEIKIHKPSRDKVIGNLISIAPNANTSKKKSKRGNSSKLLLIFVGSIVAIIIIGYFASQFYAIAKFDIVPVSYPVKINKTVVAQANAVGDSATYSIITLSDSVSNDVNSTNGAYQESKASGKMTIYNNYSATPQRLIAGTRLATSKGLIYKLTSSITVPGKTSSTAGQIAVSVIADKVGQEYNLNTSQGETLRLLGFKGTPKYNGFYAKVSGEISGGFAGTKKNISKTDLASSTKNLETQLFANLSVKVRDEIGDNTILFDNGIFFGTSSPVITDKNENQSTVTVTGVINAIVFDKKSLFNKLAGEDIISSFGDYSFDVANIDDLKVTFTNLKDFSLTKKNTLLSNFEGDVVIVARIPIEEIKSKLMGLPLSETYSVIRSYSTLIDTDSKGHVMPPWSKVPTSPDNIEINIEEIN